MYTFCTLIVHKMYIFCTRENSYYFLTGLDGLKYDFFAARLRRADLHGQCGLLRWTGVVLSCFLSGYLL